MVYLESQSSGGRGLELCDLDELELLVRLDEDDACGDASTKRTDFVDDEAFSVRYSRGVSASVCLREDRGEDDPCRAARR